MIAAYGDSLSAGQGLDSGQTFPDDLQRDLDRAGYNYHVVNLGVSGDTTTDGVERLPSVLALHPRIVIVEFGGNDGLRGLPIAQAKQNLEKIIRTLQGADIQILLAGMTLPRNYGPDYIHDFEQMYVSLADQYHLARIPFLLEGVGGHPDLMQSDGIHPTARGAQIVARTVMRYLEPMLKKQQASGVRIRSESDSDSVRRAASLCMRATALKTGPEYRVTNSPERRYGNGNPRHGLALIVFSRFAC